MALTKRRKTATAGRKRKPGAATKRRKVKSATATAKTITVKVNGVGKKYTKSSCHSTKTAAQKQADRIRAQGNNARVIPGAGGAMCVYKGGKTSSKAPRAMQRARRARA